MNKKPLAIVIMRAQPYHHGHDVLVAKAMNEADKVLIMLGGKGRPADHRNPFSYEQRVHMLSLCYPDVDNLYSVNIEEFPHSDLNWREHVKRTVQAFAPGIAADDVVMVQNIKEGDPDITEGFPYNIASQGHLVSMSETTAISGTAIRDAMYRNSPLSPELGIIESTKEFILNFLKTDRFSRMQVEYLAHLEQKSHYVDLEPPPIFVTTDSLVLCQGHILFITLGGSHGRNTYALPGGHLGQQEELIECAEREVLEATGLSVSDVPVLRRKLFSSPGRCSGYRSLTLAFRFDLVVDGSLPVVQTGCDTSHALWVPIEEIYGLKEKIVLDHFDIITEMLS